MRPSLFEADVQNDWAISKTAEVQFTVLDPQKLKVVATAAIAANETISTGNHILCSRPRRRFPLPKLWHPDHPFLYTLKAELSRGDKVVQTETTRFGIRTLAYDDKLGFVINGEPLTIRGANRHQDFP